MRVKGRVASWAPWPSSLRARLFAILIFGLAVAYGLSFSVLYVERYMSAKAVMLGTLESDVATSIAVLDRLPADQRSDLIDPLSRGNYRFVLGPGVPGIPDRSVRGEEIAETIGDAIDRRFPIRMEMIPGDAQRLQAHLTLSDGAPLTINITPKPVMPLAAWLPAVFILQMILIGSLAWLAVRQASRPLARLAAAADALDLVKKSPALDDTGPTEVAHAARAFNAMKDRLAHYLEERVQILAAISHDLQTPITRMRLRADLAEESTEKEKLLSDLSELERLVQDGIAYSRSSHGNGEKLSRIDLASFIESICYDYQDTGKSVSIIGPIAGTMTTKPLALRRILTNFIDNAIKFGGSADVEARRGDEGDVVIAVLDRGPGIPEEQIEAAMQPFYRLEQSRNRETGGSGLGLAIAQQLAEALGGAVRLRNRENGGLAAEVILR